MTDKITHITLKDNKATGIAVGNVPSVAFNLLFIASKNPTLAAQILTLYKEAFAIKEDDPSHPDEDFSLAFEEVKKLIDD